MRASTEPAIARGGAEELGDDHADEGLEPSRVGADVGRVDLVRVRVRVRVRVGIRVRVRARVRVRVRARVGATVRARVRARVRVGVRVRIRVRVRHRSRRPLPCRWTSGRRWRCLG